MDQILARLFALLRTQTGAADLSVNPGLDDRRIDELWKPTGLPLPDDYRALLRAFDGQPPGAEISFPPGQLTFLSLEDALELWRRLVSLESEDEGIESTVDDGRVRGVVYHRNRFPIADYEAGAETLFLDFIPGGKGREGQLVFNPAESTFHVVAPSVERLVGDYLSILESGQARVGRRPAEYGGNFAWLTPDGQLLDFARYQRLVRG